MNYYQHHIGDFIRDTARLSDTQCMAYLRMIWMYYETEQPLDGDVESIAFKLGALASDVLQILKHFFFEHNGKWHHARCDKEILAFRSKSDKAKKSADARWANANAMRTHSERNADVPLSDANQEPVTSNQKPSKKKKRAPAPLTTMPDDFVVDEKMAAWAMQKFPALDIQAATEKWRDGMLAKGYTYADWKAGWRTGMTNAAKWQEERSNANTQNPVNQHSNAGRLSRIDEVRDARQQARNRTASGAPDLGGVGEVG